MTAKTPTALAKRLKRPFQPEVTLRSEPTSSGAVWRYKAYTFRLERIGALTFVLNPFRFRPGDMKIRWTTPPKADHP